MAYSIVKEPVTFKLREILKNKLTGELILEGKTFKKSIFFEDGDIVFAKSNVIQERLGEILFKIGKLTRTEFWSIHKLMEGKRDKLGKVLVDKNILSGKDLFLGIQTQIKIISKSIFYINSGSWDFIEKTLDIPEDSKFHQDLSETIISSSDMIKNIFYYKDIYGKHGINIGEIGEKSEAVLTEDHLTLINRIKESPDLTCNELCFKFGYNEEKFWKDIVAFFTLNIVDFREIREKKKISENAEEILNMYDKIKLSNMDYYNLLGLNVDASPEMIKERYFLLAKKFHPDRINESADMEIREKANFVFAEINRAYDTLENPEKRKQYDIKKFKKSDEKDLSTKNLREKATIYYRKARTLYNRKQYWETTALMEEAIKIVKDKGAYYMLLGLAQMNIESMKWSAEKNLLKAAELEPMSVEPYVALGKLFFYENMENRAKSFFKKALSLDPDNKTAGELLKQLKGVSTDKGLKGFFSKKR